MSGWKITAIIFMTLFACQTAFFIWILTGSTEASDNDYTCRYETCPSVEATMYDYFQAEKLCTCYGENKTILLETYMKGGK